MKLLVEKTRGIQILFILNKWTLSVHSTYLIKINPVKYFLPQNHRFDVVLPIIRLEVDIPRLLSEPLGQLDVRRDLADGRQRVVKFGVCILIAFVVLAKRLLQRTLDALQSHLFVETGKVERRNNKTM